VTENATKEMKRRHSYLLSSKKAILDKIASIVANM